MTNNMTQELWLIDESVLPNSLEQEAEREISLQSSIKSGRESLEEQPLLAVKIQDLIIWDTQKWFGGADIRLDALVVHGNAVKGKPQSIYHPKTYRFPDIQDKEPAFKGENGLLVFFGQPQYFLDIFILVSRDRQDSQDLASLLSEELNSAEIQDSLAALLGLAVVAPQAVAIASAVGSAAILGDFAYRVLRQATSNTIGLYRTTWLQNADNFGIGRHPNQGSHHVRDFSFFYEIIQE